MIGNDVIGLGVIVVGLRFMFVYLIMLVFEIMEYMIVNLFKVDGIVV